MYIYKTKYEIQSTPDHS